MKMRRSNYLKGKIVKWRPQSTALRNILWLHHFTPNMRPGPIHGSPIMFLQPHSQPALYFVDFQGRSHTYFVMPMLVRWPIFSIYCFLKMAKALCEVWNGPWQTLQICNGYCTFLKMKPQSENVTFQTILSVCCDTRTLGPNGCKTSMWNKSC